MRFVERLRARCEVLGALCVGIDPHPRVLEAWGVSQDVRGAELVARTIVEDLGDMVAVFKPQSAFFERWGSAGVAVLERCVADVRSAGGLVILDVKRGDIGTTMAAYAAAYLGDGPLAVDAITASPYLGFGSLVPAIELAEANDRGVFVLARTSNPEGGTVQLADVDGRTVAQTIVDHAVTANWMSGVDAVGLVVGGTRTDPGVDLSEFTGAVLVPGIGAQGGTVQGVRTAFAGTSALVLPAVSREVLYQGPGTTALRDAVARLLA